MNESQKIGVKQAVMLGFFGAVGAALFYGSLAGVAWLLAPKQTAQAVAARTQAARPSGGGCGCGGA
jgi:uncharacterized membrane protein